MNELQVFTNPEFGQVRTLTIEEEPWFVGKDVAVSLGYENPQKAVRTHVDTEDRGVTEMDTPGGKQNICIINESGLYALIFGSKLESAKRFKHWVTHDVLPAIRKTGSYSIIPKARALTTDDYMKAAQLAATCRNERLPYVLGFLEQAGFNIPEVTTPAPPPGGGGGGGGGGVGGGGWIHNADNNRLMHSPTTSPYGYSSFPKEESCRYHRLVSLSFRSALTEILLIYQTSCKR